MSNDVLTLISVVIALLIAAVGASAYVLGEIRKVAAACQRDLEHLRRDIEARINEIVRNEAAERNGMRGEFMTLITRVEQELRTLAERVVRRGDMEQMEVRISRSQERLENKLDQVINLRPLPPPPVPAFQRRGGPDQE